jgi:biopolymer transport protein ExbD
VRRLRDPRRDDAATLAPLVDVLTLVLVALLLAFSTDPPLPVSLTLPRSTATAEVARALAVDLTVGGVHLQGHRIAGTAWYLDHDDDLVEELYSALQRLPPERILLRMDEAVPYRLVRKVLFTLQQAGFEDVTLVAESRSSL